MTVYSLGTAGGPLLRRGLDNGHRRGIATAVVVDGSTYLIDCGHGVGMGLADAGLSPTSLRAIFITHQHSDHVIDLNSVMVLGGLAFRGNPELRVRVVGPADRGMLPEVQHAEKDVPTIYPQSPTPGTKEMVELMLRSHATDLNDRRRDSGAPDISKIFIGEDIRLPEEVDFHPNTANHPAMEPFEVYSDKFVTVTATLVQHQPIAPAYAFRIDSAYGSVVVSGDTAPSQNLVGLARGCDLLFHEAIDLDSVIRSYPNATKQELEASMGHHRRAHTTPLDAGAIAQEAGASHLALHHLVPASSNPEAWQTAMTQFRGKLFVPCDGDSFRIDDGNVTHQSNS
ncbi:MBL fold metallo-hydrolase [Glutamicibacter sp.]|uniref:MBL fold metallo-hydrolase n=1 Tax=unclassified Glutamicibacter TaxID=2627139 RepID=UPI003D6BFDC4